MIILGRGRTLGALRGKITILERGRTLGAVSGRVTLDFVCFGYGGKSFCLLGKIEVFD
jgi:hypothetical protein